MRKKDVTLCVREKDVAWYVGKKAVIQFMREGGGEKERALAVNQPIIFHKLVDRVSYGNGGDDGFADSKVHTNIV